MLRNLVNASWYVKDSDIYRHIQVPDVISEIKIFAGKHEEKFQNHPKPETRQLLNVEHLRRMLRHRKLFELV